MAGLAKGYYERGALPGQTWVPRAPIQAPSDVVRDNLVLAGCFTISWALALCANAVSPTVMRGWEPIVFIGWLPVVSRNSSVPVVSRNSFGS